MNRTLLGLWLTIGGAIVAILSLGELWGWQREQDARTGVQNLLAQQLEPYNRDIAQSLEDYARQLDQVLGAFRPATLEGLGAVKGHPLVDQFIVLDGRSNLLYPTNGGFSVIDESLLSDARLLLRDHDFGREGKPRLPVNSSKGSDPTSQGPRQQNTQAVPANIPSNSYATSNDRSSGWTTWYHQRGLVLSYWMRYEDDSVAMAIVPRGRWLADLVSEMPDTASTITDSDLHLPIAAATSLIQLKDIEGDVLYQWGNSSLSDADKPDAEIGVLPPLEGWRLSLMLSPTARSAIAKTESRWLVRGGTVGLSLGVLALGVITSVNLNRQMKISRQQVTFVNQVSHELRTPLTNIRMYADLVLASIEQLPEAPHRDDLRIEQSRLEVIRQEAGRLGRLVENVLTFARAGRTDTPLHPQLVRVTEVIEDVLRIFAPQLEAASMVVELHGEVNENVRIDRDVLDQILTNLIGNAIKYAASGNWIGLESELRGEMLCIEVKDRGPGIPRRMRARLFQPFVRISNRLEDPAGTGIGLTIARELARRHGGDCTLLPSVSGCRFLVQLKVL